MAAQNTMLPSKWPVFIRPSLAGFDRPLTRFHFHFAVTSDNLTRTTPEVVCGYLTRQWRKIGKSVSEIVPWDSTKTPLGIWYLTQNDEQPLNHSRYFHGEYCHWKMSTLLHTKSLRNANQKETL